MHIRELRVRNFKLLRDFKLSFVDEVTGQPRQWTVLVGRNGRGKTSVLQAIALAAAGPTIANSIIGSVDVIRDRRLQGGPGAPDVDIEAEFSLPGLNKDLRLRPHPARLLPGKPSSSSTEERRLSCRLHPDEDPRLGRSNSFSGQSWYGALDGQADDSNPLEDARRFELPWWFVAAYGVGRQLSTEDLKDNDARQKRRLDSLFGVGNPVGLRFADDHTYGIAKAFVRLYKAALKHNKRLVPLISDLELRGSGGVRTASALADQEKYTFDIPGTGGVKMPASWMSHGYQSTLAWIADLVGHFLLDLKDEQVRVTKPESITGLVLIDELDLFLHPDWQMDFIESLSETFPNLQFVATTHSPLLISKLRPDQVVILDWDEDGSIEATPLKVDPRMLSASDLYEEIFGIEQTPPGELAYKRNRYEFLSQDPDRSDAEQAEVTALRAELLAERVKGVPAPISRTHST